MKRLGSWSQKWSVTMLPFSTPDIFERERLTVKATTRSCLWQAWSVAVLRICSAEHWLLSSLVTLEVYQRNSALDWEANFIICARMPPKNPLLCLSFLSSCFFLSLGQSSLTWASPNTLVRIIVISRKNLCSFCVWVCLRKLELIHIVTYLIFIRIYIPIWLMLRRCKLFQHLTSSFSHIEGVIWLANPLEQRIDLDGVLVFAQ
jgi:hypothetical protein